MHTIFYGGSTFGIPLENLDSQCHCKDLILDLEASNGTKPETTALKPTGAWKIRPNYALKNHTPC